MLLYNRDVNGVEIGTLMTEKEIVEVFGNPDYIHIDEPVGGEVNCLTLLQSCITTGIRIYILKIRFYQASVCVILQ